MKENNIIEYCKAEFENLERVVKEMEHLLSTKKSGFTVIELSAAAAFLHNFYNGVENILKRIFKYKRFLLNHSDNWHKDMLNMALKKKVIDKGLYEGLYDYLTFRHMFIHSYSFQIEWEKLKPLAVDLKSIYNILKKSIIDYLTN